MKLENVELGMKVAHGELLGQVGEVFRIWESGGTHRETTIDCIEVRYPDGVYEFDEEDVGKFWEVK